jgi:hypothetical protein
VSTVPDRPAHAAEIQSLLVRQKFLVDGRDPASLPECYTADFVLSMSFNGAKPTVVRGRDAVISEIVAGWARAEAEGRAAHVHFLGPAEITPTAPGRARARSMCLYVDSASGRIAGWGDYTDDVVRGADGWRLAARTLVATLR